VLGDRSSLDGVRLIDERGSESCVVNRMMLRSWETRGWVVVLDDGCVALTDEGIAICEDCQ